MAGLGWEFGDWIFLLTSIFENVIFCGFMTGWSSLEFVLIEEGIYSHLCLDNKEAAAVNASLSQLSHVESGNLTLNNCPAQQEMLNLAYTLASSISAMAAFPVGIAIDAFGPRLVRITTGISLGLACLLLSFLNKDNPDLLFVGLFIVCITSLTLSMTPQTCANRFKTGRSLVIGLYCAAWVVSSLTFLFFKMFYEQGGVRFAHFFRFLAVLCLFLCVNAALLYPNKVRFNVAKRYCNTEKLKSILSKSPKTPKTLRKTLERCKSCLGGNDDDCQLKKSDKMSENCHTKLEQTRLLITDKDSSVLLSKENEYNALVSQENEYNALSSEEKDYNIILLSEKKDCNVLLSTETNNTASLSVKNNEYKDVLSTENEYNALSFKDEDSNSLLSKESKNNDLLSKTSDTNVRKTDISQECIKTEHHSDHEQSKDCDNVSLTTSCIPQHHSSQSPTAQRSSRLTVPVSSSSTNVNCLQPALSCTSLFQGNSEDTCQDDVMDKSCSRSPEHHTWTALSAEAYLRSGLSYKNCALATVHILAEVFLIAIKIRLYFYVGTFSNHISELSGGNRETVAEYLNIFGLSQLGALIYGPLVGMIVERQSRRSNRETVSLTKETGKSHHKFMMGIEDTKESVEFIIKCNKEKVFKLNDAILMTASSAILFSLLALIPNLAAQIINFQFYTFIRVAYNTLFASVLIIIFPVHHLGKLMGLSALLGAIFSLIQYPLFMAMEELFGGRLLEVNIFLWLLCMLTFGLPIYLWRKATRQNSDCLTMVAV